MQLDIKGLEKIFTNIMIRHGYRSTLSMNSYNSALFFQDPFRYGFPSFVDPLTNNYIPYFFVPNITITEEFSPLVSIDMTFTNRLTARMEYRKSRQLSLSLIDYQLAENRSTELTIGADWTVRGMPLIKKMPVTKARWIMMLHSSLISVCGMMLLLIVSSIRMQHLVQPDKK